MNKLDAAANGGRRMKKKQVHGQLIEVKNRIKEIQNFLSLSPI